MQALIHPVYFGNVRHYALLAAADKVCFEVSDNYQKQTYRNRCYIATATGKHLLNVPIKHLPKALSRKGRAHQLYKDVRLENAFHWKQTHWRTLQIAYRSSPFFEYYEDELVGVFEKEYSFLLDLNWEAMETILSLLSLEVPIERTEKYQEKPVGYTDFRLWTNTKQEPEIPFPPYTQVLGKNHGFLSNLSILDLLFNEGPNAVHYLEQQQALL